MLIFLDTAKIEEISPWIPKGVLDGVTTNPSIMLKDGVTNIRANVVQIANLLGDKPVSVEVTTGDAEGIIRQARNLASWAENIVVKVPILDPDGNDMLEAIHFLEEEDIKVNVTALMSFNQSMLAAKAGASYISLFAGRVGDEGHDAALLIKQVRYWLDDWKYPSRIIVGSIRSLFDIQQAAVSGAHVITIPPKFMNKMCDHMYTRKTVKDFLSDSTKIPSF